MTFLFLTLNLYFVPWQWSRLEIDFSKLSPLLDRVYVYDMPLNYREHPLRFWEFEEVQRERSLVNYSMYRDSLLAPEVLLFSKNGVDHSEVGGFLRTPVFRKENQLALSYFNLKDNLGNPSIFFAGFKGAGKVNYDISFGDLAGEKQYAVKARYSWITACYSQGDILETFLEAVPVDNFSAKYHREGAIHNAILTYRFLSLGLAYNDEELSPYAGVDMELGHFNILLNMGKKQFGDRVENRFYSSITFNKAPFYAGFEGKIGKEGVFYYDGDLIKGAPYSTGFYMGYSSKWFKGGAAYYLPSPTNLIAILSPRVCFKEGEMVLEPGVFLKVDPFERKVSGDVYFSVLLFQAVEFRFLYDIEDGAEFGVGVNLFD